VPTPEEPEQTQAPHIQAPEQSAPSTQPQSQVPSLSEQSPLLSQQVQLQLPQTKTQPQLPQTQTQTQLPLSQQRKLQQRKLQEHRSPGVVEVVSPTVVTNIPEEIPFSAYGKPAAASTQTPAQEFDLPTTNPDRRTITISLPSHVRLRSVFLTLGIIIAIVLLSIQIYLSLSASKQNNAPDTDQPAEQTQTQGGEDPAASTLEENQVPLGSTGTQSPTQSVSLPSLYHMPLSQAETTLQQEGFTLRVTANDGQKIDDKSTWTVISQDPFAGTQVLSKTEISVTVARIEIDPNAVISPISSSGTQTVTGTFQNVSSTPLEFVEIELGLYDANGARVGTARFSKDSVSPNEVVSYEALAFLEGNTSPAVGVSREKISYRLPS
jgi:hypothetical protein